VKKNKRDQFQQYLNMVANSSILVGVLLFVYCELNKIPLMSVQIMGNPLFYLTLGLPLFVLSMFLDEKDVVDDAV